MRKRKWMKLGACALSAVLIMGLYAGPAFAEWIGTGSARAYILNGQVQTGWQQIDGKHPSSCAPIFRRTGTNSISVRRRGKWSAVSSGSMEKPIILAHQTVERWQRVLSVSTEFLIRLKTMAHRSAAASRDRREALR